MLSWLLACQRGGFVGGVVDASGDEGIAASQCTPSRPVVATAVHGLDDPNVPYNGGSPPVDSADLANPFRPVPDVLHEWGVTHEQCAATSTFTTPGWSVTHWTSCAGDVSVTLYTIDGMGHDVPNYRGGEPVDFGSLIVATAARAR
jgi:polyhydroxybutyrate depolymerase